MKQCNEVNVPVSGENNVSSASNPYYFAKNKDSVQKSENPREISFGAT